MPNLYQFHLFSGGDGPAPAGKHVPLRRVPALLVHEQAVAHLQREWEGVESALRIDPVPEDLGGLGARREEDVHCTPAIPDHIPARLVDDPHIPKGQAVVGLPPDPLDEYRKPVRYNHPGKRPIEGIFQADLQLGL